MQTASGCECVRVFGWKGSGSTKRGGGNEAARSHCRTKVKTNMTGCAVGGKRSFSRARRELQAVSEAFDVAALSRKPRSGRR